jgi:orotidine-5'-phosphate decarboxylase
VRHATVEAAKLGVSMMTIHASGGREMMEAVSKDLQDKFGERRPIVVGVTVLTSLNAEMLKRVGVTRAVNEQVVELARLAEDSGIDGVVCSPQEIRAVRQAVAPGFKIVTPGIRMPGQALDDQQRTATPHEAIAAGADYLVIGRAVTKDKDPRGALERLVESVLL